MPSQILIIPPKKPRSNRPLVMTASEKNSKEEESNQSVPETTLTDQRLWSSDNKLSRIKTIPSVRISPPQPIVDNLFDWDDEDRQYGIHRRPKFIRHRQRQKYHEPLPRIQEGISSTALVSAPTFDLPSPTTMSNMNEFNNSLSSPVKNEASIDCGDSRGQTLLHLAARLGHEEIMRMLISETSHASILLNARGQTPLLCAIEAGSTSTATILMEQDPLSLTCKDSIGSNVFHYATEQCNDIVLSRAISLLKRLSSSTARMTV